MRIVWDMRKRTRAEGFASISRNHTSGGLLGVVLCCGVIILREISIEQIRDEDYVPET